jgi:DNA mismatch repair ATPase MutL
LFNQKKKQETQNESKSETKPSNDQPDNDDKNPKQNDKEKQSEENKETKKEEKTEEEKNEKEKTEQKEEESNEKEESKDKKDESVGRYGEPPRLSTILLGVGTLFLIYYYTDIKVGQPFLTWDQFVLDVRNNVSIFTHEYSHDRISIVSKLEMKRLQCTQKIQSSWQKERKRSKLANIVYKSEDMCLRKSLAICVKSLESNLQN